MKFATILLKIQGFYFVLTAAWGLLDIESFMLVTGPKHDIWLVKTVSLLLLVTGIVYLVAAFRRELVASVLLLIILAPVSLIIIDVYYALTDVIWEVYLLDAAAEFVLLLGWLWYFLKGKSD